MAEARYAVYWMPDAGSQLAAVLDGLIGYDAASGEERQLVPPDGFEAAGWAELTSEPRRYGIHATLKAPFRLAQGASVADLAAALDTLSSRMAPFALGRARTTCLGKEHGRQFVALTVPSSYPLTQLEKRLVTELDLFRAPSTPAEIARRNPASLDATERRYLDTYGYPYVLDRFRFHITLTNATEQHERVAAAIANHLQRPRLLEPPLLCHAIALCQQPRPDARFRCVRLFPLRGALPFQIGA
jgi:2'-5' RNA ligase